jgi:hypothetical protein
MFFSKRRGPASKARKPKHGITPRSFRPLLELLEARTLLSVTIAPSNNNGQGYQGLNFSQSSGGFTPPDTSGAAGPTSFVETVNQTIAIFSPKSTGTTQTILDLPTFFASLPPVDGTAGFSDPIVTYDDNIPGQSPANGRFIVGDQNVDFGTGAGVFDIAISKTSSPATLTSADWNFYEVTTTENNFFNDYPGNFGFNKDAFVFTLNMFDLVGSNSHVQVNAVNISDMVNGVPQSQLRSTQKDVAVSFDNGAGGLRPAAEHNAAAGAPEWLVSQATDGTHINVYKMTNVLSNPTFTLTQLAVNPYTDIAFNPPLQPDGTSVTTHIDSRILNAAMTNNSLVASHAVSLTSTEDAAQWYEIDVSSGTPVLKQQGDVSLGNNTYAYYPSIDINAFGNIGMTFMDSGTATGQFMSMYVTGRTSSDTTGTMETPVPVPAGTGQMIYNDFVQGQRAGDLSGINIDPNNGSFWAVNEFANTDTSGANWGTAIANFNTAANVTVTAIAVPNQVEGQTFTNVSVATFLDSGGALPPSSYSATINWGDSTTSAGTVISNNGVLTVEGTHTYLEEGHYNFLVTVTNTTNNLTGTATSAITVNDAPLNQVTFTPPSNYPVGVPAPLNLLTFGDADPNGTLTDYSATVTWGDGTSTSFNSGNGGIVANGSNFEVFGGHTYAAVGNFNLTIQVNDVGGSTINATGVAMVTVPAITITSVSPPVAVEGNSNSGTLVTFTDSNNVSVNALTAVILWGDGSTSTLTSSNGGLVANSGGSFSVVGGHTYAEEGTGLSFAVTLTDTTTGLNATAVAFNVADAPLALSSVGSATGLLEGSTATATLATFTDSNPSGTVSDFTAVVQWGDGTTSTLSANGGGIVANTGGSFSVVGSHAYSEEGSFTFSVQIQDVGGSTTGGSGSATVADAPLTGNGLTFTGVEGTGLANAIVAQFTDTDATDTASDPASDITDYTATLTFTDSNGTHNTPGQIVFSGTGRTFNVLFGNAGILEEGNFTVGVSIHDVGGASLSLTGSGVVTDAPLAGAPLTVHAVESQTAGTSLLAKFTDTDTTNTGTDPQGTIADYSATVTFTDSTGTHTVTATVAYSGTGNTFNVMGGGFDFSEEGNYNLSVVVTDVGGATTTINSVAAVVDAPLSITATPPSFTVAEGSTLTSATVATFTDTDVTNTLSDPQGNVNDYSAVVTWDDGLGASHTSAGQIVSLGGNTYAVLASNVVPFLAGNRSITTVISDVGGASVTTSDSVTVTPGVQTAKGTSFGATEGVTFTGVIGTYQNLGQPVRANNGNTVRINWGDGTSSDGSVVLVSAGNFNIVGSHAYQEEGNYTITFTVSAAGGGGSAQASSTAALADAPLTMLSVAPPQTVLSGQPLSNFPVATFRDGSMFGSVGQYSATIQWGDGAVTTGAIQNNGNGTFSVLGSHTYGTVTNVPLVVIVHDAGGAATSGSASVTSSTPVFLGDTSVPAADPLTAFFQFYTTFLTQELQLILSLFQAELSIFGL